MKNKSMTIYMLYLGNFLVSLSLGIFLSLPLFVKSLGGNEVDTGNILWISGIGTILFVLLSKALLKTIRANFLACLGAVFYGVGALGFTFTTEIGISLYIFGLLLGAGWGLAFNTGSFALVSLVEDHQQSIYFAYLSAFIVLGTGLPPVLINYFYPVLPNFSVIFTIAVVSCILSALILFFSKVKLYPAEQALTFLENAKAIFSSRAKYPLMLVFLTACAFTIMINFQTTYAQSLGLSYAYFYISYSATVILSRLLLIKYLSQFQSEKVVLMLLGLMVIALSCFLFIGNNIGLYVFAAILFGLSYGLVYPIIQANAVYETKPMLRADVMSYFSLSYFLAAYGFPVIGATVIVYFGYQAVIGALILLAVIAFGISFKQHQT